MAMKSSGDKLKVLSFSKIFCELFFITVRRFEDYQMCLEEVLTWLLDAEETLQSMATIDENDVDLVKQQFREHEVCIRKLFSARSPMRNDLLFCFRILWLI